MEYPENSKKPKNEYTQRKRLSLHESETYLRNLYATFNEHKKIEELKTCSVNDILKELTKYGKAKENLAELSNKIITTFSILLEWHKSITIPIVKNIQIWRTEAQRCFVPIKYGLTALKKFWNTPSQRILEEQTDSNKLRL